jgi:hypothetical protein
LAEEAAFVAGSPEEYQTLDTDLRFQPDSSAVVEEAKVGALVSEELLAGASEKRDLALDEPAVDEALVASASTKPEPVEQVAEVPESSLEGLSRSNEETSADSGADLEDLDAEDSLTAEEGETSAFAAESEIPVGEAEEAVASLDAPRPVEAAPADRTYTLNESQQRPRFAPRRGRRGRGKFGNRPPRPEGGAPAYRREPSRSG